MNERYKDTDLREALRRKYADTPKLPADFMTKMRQQTEPEPARKVTLWRWVAAAACLIIMIGIGVTIASFSQQTKEESLTAKQVKSESVGTSTTVYPKETDSLPSLNSQFAQSKLPVQTGHTIDQQAPKAQKSDTKAPAQPIVEPVAVDENLHYAAYVPAEDSAYQAPSRMDEFITKLADYNKVKAVTLDCIPDDGDSTVVSTAYVFEDKQELDLFGRLLQAACWYDSKTPGYLLTFSHQQFFFTLKDLRKNEKYLWMAERIIGGRILLYSTHSPIEASVSSACFQEYREQLTHTNMSTLQF
ncbi:MAG: hypothetical protein II853_00930 [Prevotella sp.]|nr:hypothetical protein [Prevotella sp.]